MKLYKRYFDEDALAEEGLAGGPASGGETVSTGFALGSRPENFTKSKVKKKKSDEEEK